MDSLQLIVGTFSNVSLDSFLKIEQEIYICITYKNMASWEPVDVDRDEIDFENEYDKEDPIDDADLNESMTTRNKSIREQE